MNPETDNLKSTNKTSFPATVFKSFYLVDLYDEVKNVWQGRGLLYLFFLLAIASILHTSAISRSFSSFVSNELPVILESLPVIQVENGQASLEAKQPFVLESKGQPIAIFDTTGSVVSLENTDAMILITRSTLQFRWMGGGNVSEAPLSDLGDIVISKENILSWANDIKSVLPFVLYPVALAIGYIYRILQVLAYAILARVWLVQKAPGLDFDTILRLTAVSVTPAVVIEAAFVFTGIQFPVIGIFYQFVAAAYVFQTMRTIAQKAGKKRTEDSEKRTEG